ncbi:MAG: YdcF family protein [Clostridia bacterium]|nr:YdcF family protein [Clostridia bacterium]
MSGSSPGGGTPRIRRIAGDVLIALVLLLIGDMCAVMVHRVSVVVLKETYRDAFHYELILCGVLLLFSLDVRFGLLTRPRLRAVKAAGWILRAVVALLTCAILFFCGRVISGSLIDTAGPAEYAVVLGMALEDGEPAKDLLHRVDTAAQFLNDNPGASLILTGGNPDGSGKTEAAAMRELLLARGVPAEKMILEDQAKTTSDNFRNVARMTDPRDPLVLISSGYHMDRAAGIAAQAGFTHILRRPAPSDPRCYGANMLWEVVMDVNELKARWGVF